MPSGVDRVAESVELMALGTTVGPIRPGPRATVVAAAAELVGGMEVAFSYFRQLADVPKIDWIILSGGGALIPFLPEYVQAQMNIPIEIANPLRNIEYDPEAGLNGF